MPNFQYADTPQEFSKTLTSGDTEYSVAIPNGCKKIEFQCRTAYDVRFAFATGKVAGSTDPFTTLKSGYTYAQDSLYLQGSQKLYFASSQAGVVVEGRFWL